MERTGQFAGAEVRRKSIRMWRKYEQKDSVNSLIFVAFVGDPENSLALFSQLQIGLNSSYPIHYL